MIEPSEDILDRMRAREVTGVFHSRKALIDAADDLLVAGFDRADIDVSAPFDELQRRLNYQSIPPADLADSWQPRRLHRRGRYGVFSHHTRLWRRSPSVLSRS